jgi:hypothetical protein
MNQKFQFESLTFVSSELKDGTLNGKEKSKKEVVVKLIQKTDLSEDMISLIANTSVSYVRMIEKSMSK